MKIHLLRHAKTSPTSSSGKDIDRPLSTKGISQSNLMGDYLKKIDSIDEVWCSSAVRTRETLEIVKYHRSYNRVNIKDDLYLCSRDQFLEILWASEDENELMIIGHNFGISDLATYFTDTQLEMRTSEYYCIEFDGLKLKETSRGTGVIVDHYRPRILIP